MTNKVRTQTLTPYQEELISVKEDVAINHLLTSSKLYSEMENKDIVDAIIVFNDIKNTLVVDTLRGVVDGTVTKTDAFRTLSLHLESQGCAHLVTKIADIESLTTAEWLLFIETQVSACLSG